MTTRWTTWCFTAAATYIMAAAHLYVPLLLCWAAVPAAALRWTTRPPAWMLALDAQDATEPPARSWASPSSWPRPSSSRRLFPRPGYHPPPDRDQPRRPGRLKGAGRRAKEKRIVRIFLDISTHRAYIYK